MTNLESLKTLSAVDFWKEVTKLQKNPFGQYINFEQYLNSEDNDITHFLKAIGMCKVVPPEEKIKAYENSYRIMGKVLTEKDFNDYVREESKFMPLLEETCIYNMKYYTVADLNNNRILKIPESEVVEKNLFRCASCE